MVWVWLMGQWGWWPSCGCCIRKRKWRSGVERRTKKSKWKNKKHGRRKPDRRADTQAARSKEKLHMCCRGGGGGTGSDSGRVTFVCERDECNWRPALWLLTFIFQKEPMANWKRESLFLILSGTCLWICVGSGRNCWCSTLNYRNRGNGGIFLSLFLGGFWGVSDRNFDGSIHVIETSFVSLFWCRALQAGVSIMTSRSRVTWLSFEEGEAGGAAYGAESRDWLHFGWVRR